MDILTNNATPDSRQQKRLKARHWVKETMKQILSNRMLLLRVVLGGEAEWRKTAGKAYAGLGIPDEALVTMYGRFCQEAGDDPKGQLAALERAGLVNLKLDKIKGLAQFILSEQHLDEVLEKHVPEGDERDAIRRQMIHYMRELGTLPQVH